jgi:DNA-binding LacI/PurR family transcriptional regulator
MDNDILYLSLKNKICERIFRGDYPEGKNIPPERILSETYNVSRVTVRKALARLEEDGIVERLQGSGTRVKFRETGYPGTLDIIALLAPAQKPFFSIFIEHFQRNAEKNDLLVLFKQHSQDVTVEDSLFKLLQKNIRNVVIWLEDLKLENEYVRRLRALGMNMVFFDIVPPTPYADCVTLDNRDAVTSLYRHLNTQGFANIAYVGWDNLELSSARERENIFCELRGPADMLFHIPWAARTDLAVLAEKFFDDCMGQRSFPGGLICADGELGVALKKVLQEHGLKEPTVVSIDDFPSASELGLSVYAQPFEQLAREVTQCLLEQNLHAEQWQAAVRMVKGNFIER